MAVDIAPRNASGAALGVVGIASYIGAGLQDVMSGVLIEGHKTIRSGVEVYDFTYINWFLDRIGYIVGIFRFMGVECEAKIKSLIISGV